MNQKLFVRTLRGVLLLALAGTLAACSASRATVGQGAADGAAAMERIEKKQAKHAAMGAKRTDQPAEAMEFYFAQRLAPGMTVYPADRVKRAADDTRRRQNLLRSSSIGGITSWQPLGPGNIGGRTRAIVIDPTDTDVIYAGGVGGGVFKTTDGGASWNATSDDMINIAVASLVMDPEDHLTLYAGTGEGYYNGDAIRGLGIFKTTDGGATWSQLASTAGDAVPFGAFFRVNQLAISPNDSDRVYAATRTGVWRSTDAGASWSCVLDNPLQFADGGPQTNGCFIGATDLALRSDTDPDTILATFGSFVPDGVFRSTDGGDTWSQVGVGSIDVPNQGRMNIEIAPSNNDTMYVCMADNGAVENELGRLVNVFRSTDGGDTWSPRIAPGNEAYGVLLSNTPFAIACTVEQDFLSQGWYDNMLAIDPLNEDRVFVGGIDIFRSNDGGANFELISYWYFNRGDPWYVHADQHTLVFDPGFNGFSNQRVYVGNDGGVFRSDNIRAAGATDFCPFTEGDEPLLRGFGLPAVNWVELNNGYAVTQYYHGAVGTHDDVYVGGAQDNGTSKVDSIGDINGWQRVFGGDGGYCAVNHQNNDIIYAETQNFPTMIVSYDGGQNWESATNGITDTDGSFINPFAMDPTDPLVLWTGGQRIWRTTDGAANWSLVSIDFLPAGRVSAIASAPSDPSRVYVGYDNGYIATTGSGLNPTPLWTLRGQANGLPTDAAYISSVAVDPTDPLTAYMTTSTFNVDHVYKTTDGGQNWTPIDGIAQESIPDIPVHWIAVRPCDPQTLYVGTEVGVFVSEDQGGSWNPANLGFPMTVVETLAFQNDDRLVAFTHGRGAFLAQLEPCGTVKCPGDVTTTGGGAPGVPDGVTNIADLLYYVNLWEQDLGSPSANPMSGADLTTTGVASGQSGFGTPDGNVDLSDLLFFVNEWSEGLIECP